MNTASLGTSKANLRIRRLGRARDAKVFVRAPVFHGMMADGPEYRQLVVGEEEGYWSSRTSRLV